MEDKPLFIGLDPGAPLKSYVQICRDDGERIATVDLNTRTVDLADGCTLEDAFFALIDCLVER